MSVKVAVRVRPFNEREKNGNSDCCIKMVSHTEINAPAGGSAKYVMPQSYLYFLVSLFQDANCL